MNVKRGRTETSMVPTNGLKEMDIHVVVSAFMDTHVKNVTVILTTKMN